MIRTENDFKPDPSEFNPTPETAYLITDLEILVNNSAEKYLRNSPSEVAIEGLKIGNHNGEVPYPLNRIRREIVAQKKGPLPELINMDMKFTFPIRRDQDNLMQLAYHWSGDISTVIHTHHNQTLILNQDKDESTISHELIPEMNSLDVARLFELPREITGKSTSDLLGSVSSAEAIISCRTAETVIDPMTSFKLIHDARIRNDEDGERHINQELRLEINHFSSRNISDDPEKEVFSHNSSRRTMLRFTRTDKEDGWQFTGSYNGRLSAGELLSDVEYDPEIKVPSNKALNKALYVLENPPLR